MPPAPSIDSTRYEPTTVPGFRGIGEQPDYTLPVTMQPLRYLVCLLPASNAGGNRRALRDAVEIKQQLRIEDRSGLVESNTTASTQNRSRRIAREKCLLLPAPASGL